MATGMEMLRRVQSRVDRWRASPPLRIPLLVLPKNLEVTNGTRSYTVTPSKINERAVAVGRETLGLPHSRFVRWLIHQTEEAPRRLKAMQHATQLEWAHAVHVLKGIGTVFGVVSEWLAEVSAADIATVPHVLSIAVCSCVTCCWWCCSHRQTKFYQMNAPISSDVFEQDQQEEERAGFLSEERESHCF